MKQIFNLKSYLTFLSRNKAYTAINVFGLSVSLMFVILLVIYVQQEYSVDQQHRNLDRIFVFALQGGLAEAPDDPQITVATSQGFGPELKKHLPDIEDFCAVSYYPESKARVLDGQTAVCNMLFVDTTFYNLFDFDLIAGDKHTVLHDPHNAVISETFARKLFGSSEYIGRHIAIDDSTTYVVAGIFSTMGNTAITQAPDIICSNHFLIRNQKSYTNYNNSLGGAELYLLARPGADLRTQVPQLTKLLKEICPTFFDSEAWKMKPVILPLRGLYLDSSDSSMGRRGDVKTVRIFGFVAFIILLFAVMNYINLTVAQSGYRAREMASRRLFGAQRGEIMLKLILESVVLCLLSLAIGLALALWLAPYVGKLLGTRLLMDILLWPQNVVGIVVTVLLIGILAGIIPAIIQSRAKPIEVVRGTLRKTTRMLFSRAFIIIQNVITISLIAAALTIYFQIRHMVNAPLGYDHKGVMVVDLPVFKKGMENGAEVSAFMSELRRLPCVSMTSLCNSSPMATGRNGYHLDGKQHWICEFAVDENWMPLLGIEVEEDFAQAQDSLCYVNHALLHELGMKPGTRDWLPHGDRTEGMKREPLKGIVRDFHLGDINNRTFLDAAISIRVSHNMKMGWNCLVKVKGDEAEAFRQVSALYKRIFKDDWIPYLDTPYLDQWIEQAYETQGRLLNIVSLFALIAVLISLLGLVAMSTYFIQQRRKEIAVRKVFGSTNLQIRRRLIASFLVYVVVAFVIATPIAWYFMGDWLSQFSYRIAHWPWIVVAGMVCLIISYIAVYVQSYLAGNENPIGQLTINN